MPQHTGALLGNRRSQNRAGRNDAPCPTSEIPSLQQQVLMKRIVIDAAMSLYVMVTILIVLAVLMLLGAIPA